MNTIIVGVTQTATAQETARRAAELARSTGSPLHLLMSMKNGSTQYVSHGTDGFQTDWISEVNGFLENLKHEIGVPEATTSISQKDPAKALCEKADELGASMIVVGNRRVQGASRVLGSVAGSVSRHAPCDVMIVNTTSDRRSDDAPHFDTMASAELFAGCTPAQREKLGALSTSITVEKGTELTHEGRVGREFGVILDGTASVLIDGECVATLGAGDHYGEMALFAAAGSDTRHQTATIITDTAVSVSVMSMGEFSTLINEFPDIAEALRATARERAERNA